jgi:hypothetical protein
MPPIAITLLLALVQNIPQIAQGVAVVVKLAKGDPLTAEDHTSLGQALEAAHTRQVGG